MSPTSWLRISLYILVDGNWGVWTDYGTCSQTCGGGTHKRTRSCDDPSPQNGGQDCLLSDGTHGSSEAESQSCSTETCPGERFLLSAKYTNTYTSGIIFNGENLFSEKKNALTKKRFNHIIC